MWCIINLHAAALLDDVRKGDDIISIEMQLCWITSEKEMTYYYIEMVGRG